MAIKSGSILHVGNDSVLVERLQTGGPGQLNSPKDKIYELGNYESVGIIRDTPDLQYSLESLDVSCDLEALLTRLATSASAFDLSTCKPLDLGTPWAPGKDAAAPYTTTKSVAIPYLYPEQISYRFGLKENAQQTVQLRGDSIYYNPGVSYVQTSTAGVAAAGTIVTAHPAGVYTDSNGPRRVLAVEVGNDRLSPGQDYTVTTAAGTDWEVATVHFVNAVASGVQIRIVYFSNTTRDYIQSVHTLPAVKPAAIRGRDIQVYVGGYDPDDIPGSQVNRWGTVQSANVDWRVQIQPDEEFGNYERYGADYDTPEVSGSVSLKPRNPDEFFAKLRQATGITNANESIGPNLAAVLELDVVLKNPADGETLKRIHVADARFTVPGFAPRVQQKLTVEMPFDSDSGSLVVYPA